MNHRRLWCETKDGEIALATLTDLEEELHTVQREMIHLKVQMAALKQPPTLDASA